MTQAADEKRYLRAVEAAWSRLRARATLLSPRDFEVVDGWRRRGIPLRIVLEVLDYQARRGTSAGTRSLAYLASAVEESWAAVAAGRSAIATPASLPPSTGGGRPDWKSALAGMSDGTPLKQLVQRLIADADAGAAAALIDERLDDELWTVTPPELLAGVEEAARSALAPFRGRMPDAEFDKTFRRARADRLRDALQLPRLKLSR